MSTTKQDLIQEILHQVIYQIHGSSPISNNEAKKLERAVEVCAELFLPSLSPSQEEVVSCVESGIQRPGDVDKLVEIIRTLVPKVEVKTPGQVLARVFRDYGLDSFPEDHDSIEALAQDIKLAFEKNG